jgi:hypothetical protein
MSILSPRVLQTTPQFLLGFGNPSIIILSTEYQPDAATSQVYYLSFKYSPTRFGHPNAHHQELQQLQ